MNKESVCKPIIDKEQLTKVGISWNVGLGNFSKGSFMQQFFYPNNYTHFYHFAEPGKDRKYDVHFRGSTSYELAGWQRKRTIELLEETKNLIKPNIKQKVPYKEYVRELETSKIIVSPFGWGEICSRDFEAFICGATLCKPSMEHLDTFPQWYKPNETYIPIEWDYGDFRKIVENIKNKELLDYYISIAKQGQDFFRRMTTTQEGKELFVDHIISQIVKVEEK